MLNPCYEDPPQCGLRAGAVLVLLCGLFYPAAVRWSYLGAGAGGLYGVLSLIVALWPMADGGKIGRGAGTGAAC